MKSCLLNHFFILPWFSFTMLAPLIFHASGKKKTKAKTYSLTLTAQQPSVDVTGPHLHRFAGQRVKCECEQKDGVVCWGEALVTAFRERYPDCQVSTHEHKFRTQLTNPQGIGRVPWPDKRGYTPGVIYIDEAGRGALSGELYIGAVVFLDDGFDLLGIIDSKLLHEHERSFLYEEIIRNPHLAYHIEKVSVSSIDEVGVEKAWRAGIRRCVEVLKQRLPDQCTSVMLDGTTRVEDVSLPLECCAQADQKYVGVAAASILAKVGRDRALMSLGRAQEDEAYRRIFVEAKGYTGKPQLRHMEMIRAGRYTPYHRRSFDPLRTHLNPIQAVYSKRTQPK